MLYYDSFFYITFSGLRLLVSLLLDTLPALGSIIGTLLVIYFIFGIMSVQLWAGTLRNRCFLWKPTLDDITKATVDENSLEEYYQDYFDNEDSIVHNLAVSEDGTLSYNIEYGNYDLTSPNGSEFSFSGDEEVINDNSDKAYFTGKEKWGFKNSTVLSYTGNTQMLDIPTNLDNPTRQTHKTILMPIFYESPSLEDFTCGGYLQCNDIVNFEYFFHTLFHSIPLQGLI